jgi:anti-anti-sigma factor
MLEFDVVERGRDYVVVRLAGELAGEGWTDRIGRILEEHFIDDGVQLIRLDITPLTFMDSEGLATILRLRQESRARRKVFSVHGATGQVRRKLEVSGLLGILESGE